MTTNNQTQPHPIDSGLADELQANKMFTPLVLVPVTDSTVLTAIQKEDQRASNSPEELRQRYILHDALLLIERLLGWITPRKPGTARRLPKRVVRVRRPASILEAELMIGEFLSRLVLDGKMLFVEIFHEVVLEPDGECIVTDDGEEYFFDICGEELLFTARVASLAQIHEVARFRYEYGCGIRFTVLPA